MKFYPCLFIQVLRHENNAFQNFTRNLICLFDTFFTYDKLVSEIYQEKKRSFYRYFSSMYFYFNFINYILSLNYKSPIQKTVKLIIFLYYLELTIDLIFCFNYVIILQDCYYRPYRQNHISF